MRDDMEARVEATTLMLREAALGDPEILLTGDGRVSEANAGKLVGVSGEYLKKMRSRGEGPMAYKLGCGDGSRWSYKLQDLAAYVESLRAYGD
ncbi:hypothetical protein [Bradyrhizobium sp. CIR3A]|uniref:hypothetical protein n=1 Tax=Bradyrhizobium sp. CIR3A TaxID=2663838 RepID=UPI001605A598|nr:hypothetical protein [Bradyrhizobium sp. CIR3A]MBB4262663.1 hypothetical protein [Bradyrhizobium sp. CIR3A]